MSAEAQEYTLVPETTAPFPSIRSSEGLLAWVGTVDHKRIGVMYLHDYAVFLCGWRRRGAAHPHATRPPGKRFLSPDAYNQIFHHARHHHDFPGRSCRRSLASRTTWCRCMIGARDMAFPRLNALSFWMLLFGGLLLYFSFVGRVARQRPAGSATRRSAKRRFRFNSGVNYWALGLLCIGVGSVAAGSNFIVTTVKLPRARHDHAATAAVRLDDFRSTLSAHLRAAGRSTPRL